LPTKSVLEEVGNMMILTGKTITSAVRPPYPYGSEFVGRWGTADNWPAWAQLEAAARAHDSGRGFTPWPNTARFCGLL